MTPMSSNDYSSLIGQYIALRYGCGFVELTNWSSVTLTGADRQAFLHNFCTNDVKRLTPGTSCESFFTNVKGRIIGHGLITCRDDELVVIGAPGQAAPLTAHLDRYVIREDVTARDTTAKRAYALLAGGGLAGGAAIALTPSIVTGESWQKPLVNATVQLVGVPVRWIRWNLLGPVFSGLLELTPADVPRVRQALSERSATLCNEAAFETLRIEAGTPLYGRDFDDRNFPQEVGRDQNAISFAKGCYLGQETVARIDALGHVNQQLAGVRFPGANMPEVGAALTHADSSVGHVTSATFSPQLQAPLALAMVRHEHSAVGSRIDSPIGECEVVALPVPDSLTP